MPLKIGIGAKTEKGAPIGAPLFPCTGVGVRFELKNFEFYDAERSNMNFVDNAPLKCPTC